MEFIPITATAGITSFESPASDYLQLPLRLDALLVEHEVLHSSVKLMDIQWKALVYLMVSSFVKYGMLRNGF